MSTLSMLFINPLELLFFIVSRDRPVPQEIPVRLVFKVSKEWRVLKALKETRESQDPKDREALKETEAKWVCPVSPVLTESLAFKVHLDLLV